MPRTKPNPQQQSHMPSQHPTFPVQLYVLRPASAAVYFNTITSAIKPTMYSTRFKLVQTTHVISPE